MEKLKGASLKNFHFLHRLKKKNNTESPLLKAGFFVLF